MCNTSSIKKKKNVVLHYQVSDFIVAQTEAGENY
jgi:hypothetical protein